LNPMRFDLPIFPDAASTMAGRVDRVYLFLVGISLFMSAAIFLSIIFFAVRYRKGSRAGRENIRNHSWPLEIVWSAVPLAVFLFVFVWGAGIFYDSFHAPPGALRIYVVGKQWMWKIQHLNGKREIDELHVPLGQPIELMMTSEDVIHDFFIPAFRVKRDVLPGRYTTLWFQATRTGEFHIFCAQYCGTEHSAMIGRVVVMEPKDFQNWLAGGETGETMAEAGARLFQRYNCVTCHKPGGRGPILTGVFGRTVRLQGGETATADEAYIRESILNPQARITLGYQPVMPTFQGQLSESQVLDLIAYIKSLQTPEEVKTP
jgi:cytochrome c oxidase subunit II